ncbi:hypothetical protein O5O45_19105 [Hahella aquimaris]|uniref:hypothetical protein n=1 Tax=Hahella sp. HNIBRBA332 TaxID=3015983 RepID=UPI00273B9AD7|nr:hypothetical protein [Hahella sp. HNIBRBA332]WLQ11840.1 hypothetical protein O5O45_19105 [Hahella sp. HNIBRBA332]
MGTFSYRAFKRRFASLPCMAALSALTLFTAVAHAETIATGEMGQCQGSVEFNIKALTFRLAHSEVFYCGATQEETIALLEAALKALPDDARIEYLVIGRLIDYDWIGAALVAKTMQDKSWNAAQARPQISAENGPNAYAYAYVGAMLADEPFASVWNRALKPRGLGIAGASIEKLLISGPDVQQSPAWVPSQKGYPFDAILYYRLRPLSASIATE